MKVRLYIVLALLLFSCNEDDIEMNEHPIVGEWELIETQFGFGLSSNFYEPDNVTYTFNSNGSVEIISTIAEFESQVITYAITQDCFFEGCPSGSTSQITDIITINSDRYFLLQIDNDNLKFGRNDIGDGTDYILTRL